MWSLEEHASFIYISCYYVKSFVPQLSFKKKKKQEEQKERWQKRRKQIRDLEFESTV